MVKNISANIYVVMQEKNTLYWRYWMASSLWSRNLPGKSVYLPWYRAAIEERHHVRW